MVIISLEYLYQIPNFQILVVVGAVEDIIIFVCNFAETVYTLLVFII